MYYKVMKDNRVIDVLDRLVFLKYDSKHRVMVLCEEEDAQAILSSDKEVIWHEETLYNIPTDGFDTVSVIEIDKYEYQQLKALNYKTPNEIVDAVIFELINNGVL